ncbi:MAG: hypothetical protein P1U86_16650 [Verrucomicrobiales bacterium]|nr:hypothetical protein [Verrucomicrobiales bacterium]
MPERLTRDGTYPILFFRPHLTVFAIALLCGGLCWGTDEIDFLEREAFTEKPSDNGTVTLKWSNPRNEAVALEQSGNAGFDPFVVRYEGTDTSSVLSGLAEGKHYFRVGAAGGGPRSETLAIEVEFFPRDQLAWLLGIGGVVVVLTIGTIIVGAAQNREKEAG